MTLTCTEAHVLLPALPLGALEPHEHAALDAHLPGCARCRDRARAIDEAYRAIPEAPPREKAASDDPLWTGIAARLDEKTAAAKAAPLVSIALVCCFCRDGVTRDEAAYCASCLAPHHPECFRAHGRCSAFGCEETRTVRPALEAKPRRSRGLVIGIVSVLGAAGVAAFATDAVAKRRYAHDLARIRAEADAAIAKVRADAERDFRSMLEEATARVRAEARAAQPAAPPATELEERIDATFVEIERAITSREIDKLVPLFVKLNDLMREYGTPATDAAKRRLASWHAKLEEWKEVRLAIQLQIWINEGNDYLRALLKAKQAADRDAAEEVFSNVRRLVQKMRAEERTEFHRNADAILLRAKTMIDEVRARPR